MTIKEKIINYFGLVTKEEALKREEEIIKAGAQVIANAFASHIRAYHTWRPTEGLLISKGFIEVQKGRYLRATFNRTVYYEVAENTFTVVSFGFTESRILNINSIEDFNSEFILETKLRYIKNEEV